MHDLPIDELERRAQAYDPDSATRDEWREHVALVRQLFRHRLHLLRVIREASEN